MARWRALEEYTPIARLLVDYMWEQRPPLLPSQFAARMGLPKQLVSSWLSGQATPSPAASLRLARRMDQPVSWLLMAAGYTRETDPLLDIPEAWSYVLNALHRLRDQRSAGELAAEEAARFAQLEALLLAAQEMDLDAWRAEATARGEAGADGAFWSRRRRRSRPMEDSGGVTSVNGEDAENTEDGKESEDVQGAVDEEMEEDIKAEESE
jgi:transcriptional regulator with XRE-family HTH domain